MKDPKIRLRELLETMPLDAEQKKHALDELEELSPESVEMVLEQLEGPGADLPRFSRLFKEACEAQRQARQADPRTKLRELLKAIPFGSHQKELMEHNLEGMSRERAEELLKLWEEAGESAERALKAAKEYRKGRTLDDMDPAWWSRWMLRSLLAYYFLDPEARKEALQSIADMDPQEVEETLVQVRQAIAQLPEEYRDDVERLIEAGIGFGIWMTP